MILRVIIIFYKMRFYKNVLPKINEIVMVEVTSVGETNISVKLLEYDNIEGMVLIADASMRKKKKIIMFNETK